MHAIRFWGPLTAGAMLTTAAAIVPAAPVVAMQAADASGISGTWTTSFDSQVGKQTYVYTFKVEGGKLTGHSKSNLGESDLTGTVDKDKVTLSPSTVPVRSDSPRFDLLCPASVPPSTLKV